jgi:hypothetical protein
MDDCGLPCLTLWLIFVTGLRVEGWKSGKRESGNWRGGKNDECEMQDDEGGDGKIAGF